MLKTIDIKSVEELSELYKAQPEKPTIIAMHNNVKMMPKTVKHYSIYTATSLDKLTDEIKPESTDETDETDEIEWALMDETDKNPIRYMLHNDILLFAEEGFQPAHFVMNGAQKPTESSCSVAGNLFFNEKYSCITKINNKSGDFEPADARLKSVLGIIVKLSQAKKLPPLKDPVIINHQRSRKHYSVPVSILEAYVNSDAYDQTILTAQVQSNKSAKKRTVTYTPEKLSLQTCSEVKPQQGCSTKIAGVKRALFSFSEVKPQQGCSTKIAGVQRALFPLKESDNYGSSLFGGPRQRVKRPVDPNKGSDSPGSLPLPRP